MGIAFSSLIQTPPGLGQSLNGVCGFIIFVKPLPTAVGRVRRFYREE
jgi:hypothetical protein